MKCLNHTTNTIYQKDLKYCPTETLCTIHDRRNFVNDGK